MEWNRNHSIVDNVLDAIGLTPMIRLNRIAADITTEICIKLEYTNPSGSLKDRVVKQIIREAENEVSCAPV